MVVVVVMVVVEQPKAKLRYIGKGSKLLHCFIKAYFIVSPA